MSEKITIEKQADKITTYVRRATSVVAFVFFFGLIIVDFVLGWVAKDVPMFIYCLLASLAVIAHDKFGDLVQQLRGGVGK